MKKIITLLLAIAVLLSLCSCSNTTNSNSEDKLNIVTTAFPQYDFTRQITGDKANLTLLLPPGSESHTYEPTPKDIIKIEKSDIFIYVGGESDSWIDKILESVDTKNKTIIKLLDCVTTVNEETVEGMENGEEDEAEGEEIDEHVWTSPKNAIKITNVIAEKLQEKDKANAEAYKSNTDEYVKALTDLDSSFKNVVSTAKRKTIVFGDRFPFRYFADEYGLTYYAAFPGCSAETEPSAATLAFLVEKINQEKIPVVFHIEMSNEEIAKTISGETGAEVLQMHSCHNVSKDELESGATYLSLMEKNVDNLKIALN